MARFHTFGGVFTTNAQLKRRTNHSRNVGRSDRKPEMSGLDNLGTTKKAGHLLEIYGLRLALDKHPHLAQFRIIITSIGAWSTLSWWRTCVIRVRLLVV